MGAGSDVARKMREPAHMVDNVISLIADISVCDCLNTFSAIISMCEEVGQRRKALTLLDRVHETDIMANVISFSAVISACEEAQPWQQALPLCHKMCKTSMTADVIRLSTAICAKSIAGIGTA